MGKLGYGTTSTVWLCKDSKSHKYLTAKICSLKKSQSTERELQASRRLQAFAATKYLGRERLQGAINHFHIAGTHGEHLCMLFPPHGSSLSYMHGILEGPFPPYYVKSIALNILLGLNFLHTEAHMIHTDLNMKNILLGLKDHSVLSQIEQAELTQPSERKVLDDRCIYQSWELGITTGIPAITDLGQMRCGIGPHTGMIMPFIYRAPEVVLGMEWSEKVDIWNLGVLLWHMIHKHVLFCRDGSLSTAEHIADFISVLGHAAKEFLKRDGRCSEFFDQDGGWAGKADIQASRLLAEVVTTMESSENDLFITFMRKMLQWDPEARATARELLEDKWLFSEA